jgi:hypothetical protein
MLAVVVAGATAAATLAAVLGAGQAKAHADEWTETAPVTDSSAAAPAASADRWAVLKTPFEGDRPDVFDLHGGITYYGFGLGVGARYTWQIVNNGFIPRLNNSFGIGFGADVFVHPAITYFTSFGLSFIIPVVAQWAFYLTKEWTVFAEVGAGLWIRPLGIDYQVCDIGPLYCSPVWWVWITGVGAMYHFSPQMALILRAQYPFVSAGIAF